MSSTYVLDNAAAEAADRFRELERLYDSSTFAQLDAVGVAEGWRCWEVGAGGGSVALELARRVGPTGTVWATDLDTRWTRAEVRAAALVLTHDVVREAPPVAELDLIHVRLVASHLPEWDEVLPRLVAALRPGGWLLVEELDPMHRYQPHPRDERDHLLNRVGDAFTATLASRGGNPQLGRDLGRQLTAAGLAEVTHAGLIVSARGGDHPAARLMRANAAQMAEELAQRGISRADLGRYAAAMSDPATSFLMPTFWAARAHRPR